MTKPWYSTKFTTNSTSSAAFTLCRRSTSACLVRGGGFRAPLLTVGEPEVFQSFSCLPAFFCTLFPHRPNWWKSEVDATRGSNKHGAWTYHSGKGRGSDRPQARMKFSVIVNMRSELCQFADSTGCTTQQGFLCISWLDKTQDSMRDNGECMIGYTLWIPINPTEP